MVLLRLSYLIEGTSQTSRLSVPYNSKEKPINGDTLRQEICAFNFECLAHDSDNVSLLKIDVDPDRPGNHLPLLRFKKGDEGVEELSPWKTLSEIWPEPPPAHRIHIFVTFTNLTAEMRARKKTLEAAYLVYYKFWWEGLDKQLQPVPGCNLKYLPEELINSLKLKRLSFGESVLLVREEYEVAFTYLQSKKWFRGDGMVVTGHPGIGKTCFLYYLLFRLLSERNNVAFQVNDQFILFQDTGVQICNVTAGPCMPDGTWALTDSHTGFDKPCPAFLTASASCRARVVQTTSPVEDNWRSWSKHYNVHKYWMDVVTLDELNVLGKLLGLNTKILRDSYNSWGPSARICVRFAEYPELISGHEQAVFDAAFEIIKDHSHFDPFTFLSPSARHDIFVLRPSPGYRYLPRGEFGTNRLREIFTLAYTHQDHAVRQRFYRSIRREPWFVEPARQMFEIHVLLWFWHARSWESLPCKGTAVHSPQLEIPACPENLKFFYKPEELQTMNEPGRPMCLVPTSPIFFPNLDAIVLTDNAIITAQITVTSNYDSTKLEFDHIHENIPPGLLTNRPGRYHVLISDRCHMREQKSTHIPLGTHVYSTVLDMDQLDSKALVTEERVKALEKAREPPPSDRYED